MTYPVSQGEVDPQFKQLITAVRSSRRNPNWPGMPLGQWPLALSAELDAAIADDVVHIDTRDSVTRPSKKAKFIVLGNKYDVV
jgi:hypothetical protein